MKWTEQKVVISRKAGIVVRKGKVTPLKGRGRGRGEAGSSQRMIGSDRKEIRQENIIKFLQRKSGSPRGSPKGGLAATETTDSGGFVNK